MAKARAAERLSEINEADDERRKAGAPRGPSGIGHPPPECQ